MCRTLRPSHECVAERVGGYYTSLALGSVMNFAESPETVPDNLREVQPTAFLAVPRIWEKFYSGVTIALKDATPFQNWMYRRAMAVGYRMTDGRLDGETPSLVLRLANRAAYWLVFRNIRRMLGLDRCRIAFTGAAPIAPDLIRWYLALGIDMREVYGQTENCGVATLMPSDRIKLGSVGAGAGARLRSSVLGDICEAVIGAVYLDGGYAAAAAFVERNWTERMRKPVRPLRDPKTVLQEWAQGKGLPTPVYREVERTGPHHDPRFRVAVELPGLDASEGIGGSKRAAEKAAASAMIAREGVK